MSPNIRKNLINGVNVFGHFSYGFGLAKAGKYFIRALDQTGFPYCVRNIPAINPLLEKNPFKDSDTLTYPVNFYFINQDSIKSIKRSLAAKDYEGKYEIGVWFWELEDFPEFFHSSFSFLDEIWVFTDFIYQAISKVSPIPVRKIPFPYFPEKQVKPFPPENEDFTYLMIFDYNSDFERKNPMAAVKAFKMAFPDKEGVRLVIKSTNGNSFPHCRQSLEHEAENDRRIRLIDEPWEKERLHELIFSSHAMVSLHRAEGYGLNIIDGIVSGKPVITTGYGGNMEFIPSDYPFLVRYEKVKVKAELEFYQIDSAWAEPDINEAAEKMKWVQGNYDEACRLTNEGREKIILNTDYKMTMDAVIKRLSEIDRNGFKKNPANVRRFVEDEFFQLNSFLSGRKLLRLFIFVTARKARVMKLITNLRTMFPECVIDLFGRNDEELKKMSHEYYEYTGTDFFKSDSVDFSWFKNKYYDLAIVPFFNYCGNNYGNVIDIAKKAGISKIIGIGIEGDIFPKNA